jgi:sporulation protein YlmC with PRC-barrel domain
MTHVPGMVKASDEVIGREVKNHADEHLGKVKEIVLDKLSGQVAYVVLDSGSFLGLGGKYFALPWNAIHFDNVDSCFRVNIDKERLKNAPGFDKDNWPDMADRAWGKLVYSYYGTKAYWE